MMVWYQVFYFLFRAGIGEAFCHVGPNLSWGCPKTLEALAHTEGPRGMVLGCVAGLGLNANPSPTDDAVSLLHAGFFGILKDCSPENRRQMQTNNRSTQNPTQRSFGDQLGTTHPLNGQVLGLPRGVWMLCMAHLPLWPWGHWRFWRQLVLCLDFRVGLGASFHKLEWNPA